MLTTLKALDFLLNFLDVCTKMVSIFVPIKNEFVMQVSNVAISNDDTIAEKDLRASMQEVKAHLEGKINLPNARDID